MGGVSLGRVVDYELTNDPFVTADGKVLEGLPVAMALVRYENHDNYRPATDTEIFLAMKLEAAMRVIEAAEKFYYGEPIGHASHLIGLKVALDAWRAALAPLLEEVTE